MPCPTRTCSCESPALRNAVMVQPPPGTAGMLYGACECSCHTIAAAELLGLNPTEALFGFVSWLTTREQTLKIGPKEDAAPLAELLQEYVNVNKLPHTRPDWMDRIRTPPPKAEKKKG